MSAVVHAEHPVWLSPSSRSGSARGRSGASSRRHRRRRAGGAVARDRSGAARPARRRCSTTPTGSARARARSVSRNGRWNSGIGSASASRMVDKGVVWSVGKIFHGDSQLYQFNLLPEEGHKMPGLHQSSAILRRSLSGRSRAGTAGDRSALAQQGHRAGAAQRSRGADHRYAGRAVSSCRQLSLWRAMVRARRCAAWWVRNSRARCSRISS